MNAMRGARGTPHETTVRRLAEDPPSGSKKEAGFTLLEVMIALAIFFVAMFTILDSTSRSLRAARGLEMQLPDVSMLAAELALTNRLEEGVVDGDFGDLYPDFTWTRDIYEVRTNGLFRVDFTIRGAQKDRNLEWETSILLWRPDSQSLRVGGSPLGRRR